MSIKNSLLFAAALLIAPLGKGDEVDRLDPDFVHASLLIMGPGETLYSCYGHACLRLECKAYDLDYCFSYEAEPVENQVFRFFRGDLKMGMFSVPTEEFLKQYVESGRGVRQYRLNLPPEIKVRLWKIMDDAVAKGPYLEYDYIKRSCAYSLFRLLQSAVAPKVLELPPWTDKFNKLSRREILAEPLGAFPWTRFAIHTIVGWQGDKTMSNFEKIVLPSDLVILLREAKISGVSSIKGDTVIEKGDAGKELLPNIPQPPPSWCTPMVVAIGLLVFIALFGVCPQILGAIVMVLGGFLTYLIAFSALPATDWNWLIIPFNPLSGFVQLYCTFRGLSPKMRLVCWVFAFIDAAWVVAMALVPHQMTDPAYLVLALACAVLLTKKALMIK